MELKGTLARSGGAVHRYLDNKVAILQIHPSFVRSLGRFTERGGRAEFRWDPQTAKQPEPRHLPDGTTHVRLGRLGRFTKKGGVCGISMGSAQVSIYLVF